HEIDTTDMQGEANWLYFGGGTPNVLAVDEIGEILDHLRRKVALESIGIELLPALLTETYLDGLQQLGVTKVSVGIESLAGAVIEHTGRSIATVTRITRLLEHAGALGLWTNVDLMVGLPRQSAADFLEDVRAVALLRPSQVTVYPFMVIRGVQADPGMPEATQFALIDQAHALLKPHGYGRPSVWAFTRGDDMYDSSRDELVEDYIGFGPAAFSTYDHWKVVNPDVASYLRGYREGQRLGFVAPKSATTDQWRRFARMLYDLDCAYRAGAPGYINGFIALLKLAGYGRRGRVTDKGRLLAHALTKTVVEALPFPLQNRASVENFDAYLAYREGG
ncbi:MAG: radical SAM protein, partial [Anaerolineae bacterium]|nr:radical SAM protein [Anaerolineae bacterium]